VPELALSMKGACPGRIRVCAWTAVCWRWRRCRGSRSARLHKPLHKLSEAIQTTGRRQYLDDLEHAGELHACYVQAAQANAALASLDPSPRCSCQGWWGSCPRPLCSATASPTPWWDGEELFASQRVVYHGQPVGLVVATSPVSTRPHRAVCTFLCSLTCLAPPSDARVQRAQVCEMEAAVSRGRELFSRRLETRDPVRLPQQGPEEVGEAALCVAGVGGQGGEAGARGVRGRAAPIVTLDDALAAGSFFPEKTRELKAGSMEAALAAADVVVEGHTAASHQYHFTMESQRAVALPGEDGMLTVYSSTQNPALVSPRNRANTPTPGARSGSPPLAAAPAFVSLSPVACGPLTPWNCCWWLLAVQIQSVVSSATGTPLSKVKVRPAGTPLGASLEAPLGPGRKDLPLGLWAHWGAYSLRTHCRLFMAAVLRTLASLE